VPPAKIMAPRLRSAGEEPIGVKDFFVTSYAAKYLEHRSIFVRLSVHPPATHDTYAALPGPSRARVTAVPRKMLRIPPSLYKCRITSNTPLYF
jgi:hypothetical protein